MYLAARLQPWSIVSSPKLQKNFFMSKSIAGECLIYIIELAIQSNDMTLNQTNLGKEN